MKRKLSANMLKITVILTVVVSLVVGVALPGVAAPDEVPPQANNMFPNMLRGKVTSVGEDVFVIESGEEEGVTVAVDDSTKYFKVSVPRRLAALAQPGIAPGRIQAQERVSEGPVCLKSRLMERLPWLKRARINQAPPQVQEEGQELTANWLNRGEGKGISKPGPARLNWLCRLGEEASFEDIAVGDKVAVMLLPDQDTSVAELVLIIKAPTVQRIHGTVTAVSEGSITVMEEDGSSVVLNYDENTTFILKGAIAVESGQSIRVVYNSEDMVAKLVRVNLEAAD